jgi:hypothetical protein
MKTLQAYCIASAPVLDGGGECGSFTHYVFILTLVGSAFLIFLYLWKKGKLDMDEEPKHMMMKDEDKETRNPYPPGNKGDPHDKS